MLARMSQPFLNELSMVIYREKTGFSLILMGIWSLFKLRHIS
jgi:hypothetical protein